MNFDARSLRRRLSPRPSRPGRPPFPDAALAHAARAGDAKARDWLAERLASVPAILRARNRRAGFPLTSAELDDVGQDALLAIWRKLGSFEGRSRLETWIFGFCINQFATAVQGKQRQRPALPWDEVEEPVPMTRPTHHGSIDKSLQTLGPPAADVIRLRHFDDRTFEEIAVDQGVALSTVKSQYYRGLRRLGRLLTIAQRAR